MRRSSYCWLVAPPQINALVRIAVSISNRTAELMTPIKQAATGSHEPDGAYAAVRVPGAGAGAGAGAGEPPLANGNLSLSRGPHLDRARSRQQFP